jgi:hypothetical protein
VHGKHRPFFGIVGQDGIQPLHLRLARCFLILKANGIYGNKLHVFILHRITGFLGRLGRAVVGKVELGPPQGGKHPLADVSSVGRAGQSGARSLASPSTLSSSCGAHLGSVSGASGKTTKTTLLKTGSLSTTFAGSSTSDVWSDRAQMFRSVPKKYQGKWGEGLGVPLPMVSGGVPGIQRESW